MLQRLTLFLRPRHLLLPLVLLSVVATGISFLPQSVGIIGRWVFLGLLAIHIVAGGRALALLNSRVALALAAYICWCLFTAFWSELPSLSATKAGALALAAFAALWGGQEWARGHRQALGFLWPTAAVALLAGGPGNGEVFEAGGEFLHAGATINPNFLGTVVAMSLPLALWVILHDRSSRKARLLGAAILLTYLVVLYLAASRGAYLIFLGTTAGAVLALKPRRALLVTAAVLWITATLSVAVPDAVLPLVSSVIYKNETDAGVFRAREIVWADSYEAAALGGLAGAGYGVSIGGDPSQIDSLFSTQVYTREKGNSQLAIVEETGLIGLGFYVLLIGVLFHQLLAGLLTSGHGERRVVRGMIAGTLAGMLGQSFVEAWWIGPGSPEFVFFWAMAGAGVTLARMDAAEAVVARRHIPVWRARVHT